MNLNKSFLTLLALVCLSITLVACSDSKEGGTEIDEEVDGEPQEGGTIVGGLETAPGGVFNPIFYTDLTEEKMMEFTHESLVTQNAKLEFIPELAKEWKINESHTEITFKLEEGVTWHDGEKFTAEDVVFTYKTLSDPGYVSAGGLRTTYVQPLLNYEEYSSGKTDKFEAVVAEDEYTVTFKFEKPNTNLLYYASFPIIPKHIFKDIPVSEMPESPASLDPSKVVGTGPFQFSKMIVNERYEMKRYDNYWRGKPHLDKVVWKVVDQSVMVGLLKKGELDFIAQPGGIPAPDFKSVANNPNIETVKQTGFGYQVLGFKLNHRTTEDVQKGIINPDNWEENEKLSNKKVRQAIAHAINRKGIVKGLLFGQGEVINSPIAQQFWAYNEDAVKHYEFNKEIAKSMLDAEGYVDQNGDGMRENPDGEKWVLNLNYPTGNKIRERVAPIIKQQLEEVGVSVNLRQPKEMSAYLEEIEKDNNDWDLYLIGWGLSSKDPDPSELWATESPYNYSRWNNQKADMLLQKAMEGPKALDRNYRKKMYAKWQKEFSEDLPAIILYAKESLWGYNKRLNGVNPLPFTLYNDTHKWWVSGQ